MTPVTDYAATVLLCSMRSAGYRLEQEKGRLLVTPGHVAPEVAEAIREAREGILALLEAEHQERVDEALAAHPPDFSKGPVQMTERVVVTVWDRVAVFTRDEWDRFRDFLFGWQGNKRE